jgi:hypothetical protein
LYVSPRKFPEIIEPGKNLDVTGGELPGRRGCAFYSGELRLSANSARRCSRFFYHRYFVRDKLSVNDKTRRTDERHCLCAAAGQA